MLRAIGKALKNVALGDADVAQQCTVGTPDPQREVAIWLEGLSDPLDITSNHVVACASPFTVGIGLDREQHSRAIHRRLSIKVREQNGECRLLAQIGLRSADALTTDSAQQLSLFHTRSCSNYCLPPYRIWAHDLYHSFIRWRTDKNPEIPISRLGAQSMNALFMCPRPVVLVSAMHGQTGNMFPMNLFGSIGNGYFAFALNSLRKAAPLVERAGRVALSSIPIEQAHLARQLGRNHRKECADWDTLPFATRRSNALDLPIPAFALRVREMEIKFVRKLGSHALFLARVIRDDRLRDDPQFCTIHGLYDSWRKSVLRQTHVEVPSAGTTYVRGAGTQP